MISVPADEDNPDDAEPDEEDVQVTLQEILREASMNLPSHIARGAVSGISGTYSATLVNLNPSATSRWRYRKKEKEQKASRDKLDAAFKDDPSKKSLMHHFFPPAINASNYSNVVPKPIPQGIPHSEV